MAAIEALDLGARGPDGSLMARVRDAFLFSLYAAGVRFGDVARLRRRNVVEDDGVLRLSYAAGKTGKRTSVLLLEPAVAVLAPYLVREDGPQRTGRLPVPDPGRAPQRRPYDLTTPEGEYAAVSSQNALHNKYLKEIAELAGSGATCRSTSPGTRSRISPAADGWSIYQIKQALQHCR